MIKFFINLKLKYKLFLSYLIIIILLTCTYLVFFENAIGSVVEKNIISSSEKLLILTGKEIAACLQTVEDLQNSFITNTQIQKILSKNPAQTPIGEQLDDFAFLESTLNAYQSYKDIGFVTLMVNPDFLYANNKIVLFPFLQNETATTNFEKDVYNAHGKALYSLPFKSKGTNENIIRCGKLLRSYKDFSKFTGAVYIDISQAALSEKAANASHYENHIYLISDDNKIMSVYSPTGSENMHPKLPDILNTQTLSELDDNFIFTYSSLGKSGWSIVSALPTVIIKNEKAAFRSKIITVTVIITAVVLVVSLLASHIYTQRMSKLMLRLEQAPNKNFKQFTVKYNDEIAKMEKHLICFSKKLIYC